MHYAFYGDFDDYEGEVEDWDTRICPQLLSKHAYQLVHETRALRVRASA